MIIDMLELCDCCISYDCIEISIEIYQYIKYLVLKMLIEEYL